VPAVIVILAVRAFEPAERDLTLALGELGLYIAVTAVATLAAERRLLAEAVSYLRRRDRAEAHSVG
jgi:hypothetical protein